MLLLLLRWGGNKTKQNKPNTHTHTHIYIYVHIYTYKHTCVSPPNAAVATGSREGRASRRTDRSVHSPTATREEEEAAAAVSPCVSFMFCWWVQGGGW
jgi:hypothetical protein